MDSSDPDVVVNPNGWSDVFTNINSEVCEVTACELKIEDSLNCWPLNFFPEFDSFFSINSNPF